MVYHYLWDAVTPPPPPTTTTHPHARTHTHTHTPVEFNQYVLDQWINIDTCHRHRRQCRALIFFFQHFCLPLSLPAEDINSYSVAPSGSTKAAHLCVLVIVTAARGGLLDQTPYFCGLAKVKMDLWQLDIDTKCGFRVTHRKYTRSTFVEVLTRCSTRTLRCPFNLLKYAGVEMIFSTSFCN